MNGRVYDPQLGRFLSADPHVQAPYSSQSYNRYAYAMNNPLKYTDPSGYFFKKLFKSIKKAFKAIGKFFKKYGKAIVAIAVGALVGGWTLMALTNTATFGAAIAAVATAPMAGVIAGFAGGFASGLVSTGSVKGALRAGLFAGVSAGVANFIGGLDIAVQLKDVFHGVAQGIMSELSGGEFRSGFLGGLVGHAAGRLAGQGKLGELLGKTIYSRTATAAVIGGTAAAVSGGKFANGAVSAAFAHLFNNESKKWSFEKLKDSYQTKGELMPNLENSKFPPWAIDAIDASDGGSCAARMSNAFNRAGYGDFIEGAPRRFGDGSGNYYVLGAAELADHIGVASSKYLVTDLSSISGKTGIIYFENYHVDLYDGSGMVGNRGHTEQYFNKKSTYFMEVK